MSLSLIITAITNIINLSLLGFVLRKRDGISLNTHTFVFAGSILALVLWATGNYMADTSSTLESALFWTRAAFPLALFMCWFILYFSFEFPTKRIRRRGALWIYLVLTILFSVASFGSAIVEQVSLDPKIGISEVVIGPMYLYVVALYLVLIIHTTANFIQDYLHLCGREKIQIGYVLTGWGTFLFFAVFTNAILPFITGNANWSKFGPLGSIIMSTLIAYAIVRHEFLNIKVIIQRGLVYSVLISLIVGVYVILLFATQFIFSVTTEIDSVISAAVTALVGIFGVPPLKTYFQKVTSRIFFKDRYDYATVLEELASVLNENIVRDSILKKTTAILEQSLKVKDPIFWMEPQPLPSREVYEISIPIKCGKKKIGVLYLGQKLSGDAYSSEDMSLLHTFCVQAGVAIEKASLYATVKEYADTLEVKVAERTAEIQRLQKDQEAMMLEISHGLQTPLTIMKGELFFLRKQGYETSKIDVLDTSINRISVFIKKLLGLYRLEASSHAETHDVELQSLLKEVVASFSGEVAEGKIEIVVSKAEKVIVQGVPDELEEVISNLLSNAIKYSEKGKKNIIKISLLDTKEFAQIMISDTGIGVHKEYLKNLFKKFYRVKDEKSKGIHGTGLGLVICKKIIDMHGGKISVKSVYGDGTTFTIMLPKN
ncbi:MAG: GHKL domain-containing protein [Candidatus Pacebacteria bacterium]|nr:GHKL domain-containing protein [Candidatus Paceibacterota bacterium]MCF7857565.1 GHKL domain-containing protein [Candidatus Paceibacterota bacterium]